MKAVNKLTGNTSASTWYKWKHCSGTARMWIHLGKICYRRCKYDQEKGTTMTVKPIETSSKLIKDFTMVKLEILYDTILLEVQQQKECVSKKPACN